MPQNPPCVCSKIQKFFRGAFFATHGGTYPRKSAFFGEIGFQTSKSMRQKIFLGHFGPRMGTPSKGPPKIGLEKFSKITKNMLQNPPPLVFAKGGGVASKSVVSLKGLHGGDTPLRTPFCEPLKRHPSEFQ